MSIPSTVAAIDLAAARADTPGCAAVIHLNNAGAALPPKPVTESIVRYVEREAQIGGYEAAEAAQEELESTYSAVASLIGAQPHQIALTENATRAWDMAFYSINF